MTESNVEVVREGLAAFARGDVEGMRALVHPDIVTVRTPPFPDPQTYHGIEGVLRMYADWTADFKDFAMHTGEFTDAGDRVVVEVFQRGEGRASGAVVEGHFWFVYTVTGGRVARLDAFATRSAALQAAGLPGIAA